MPRARKAVAICGTAEANRIYDRHRIQVLKPCTFEGEVIVSDGRMNCHGHALGVGGWFDPGFNPNAVEGSDGLADWVEGVQRSWHISAWRRALRRLGWIESAPLPFSESVRQIAVFGDVNGYVTHSALLIGLDSYESKLGKGPIVRGHKLVFDPLFRVARWFFLKPVTK